LPDLLELHRAAREIFSEALRSVDAGSAVWRAVSEEGSRLRVVNTIFSTEELRKGFYVIAIGKAAHSMATALNKILGERLIAGVITAPAFENSLNERWRMFAGGHPLPNHESMNAARAAFDLLRRAEEERAPVIFLISGGGSAMMEWPRDEEITLEELRAANSALVSCGASITEINSVRRAVSAVKGGRLAARAPHCKQVSLIVSDTNHGEETCVASGPTFDLMLTAPDAASVISRYKLEATLPHSILRAIKQPDNRVASLPQHALREHYVLLENETALGAAAEVARERGYVAEIARDINEQPIAEGCSLLLTRLFDLRRRVDKESIACLISGGEFACPVRGRGMGGRNAESALRWAIELESYTENHSTQSHVVALSAGTDGIDGNSPAAGAVADETTLARARIMQMDARQFLSESDAYNFFQRLNDAIVTGATGRNVRDVRIMIAS
jgi:hydroxypyruvate reductase